MVMTQKVYIVQNQHYLNSAGELIPRFDFSHAETFGEIQFILGDKDVPWKPNQLVDKIREQMEDFQDGDNLLLMGNPIFIGLCTMVAFENADHFNFLQWSGKRHEYQQIHVSAK